jgi:FkbM family methyltransferase
MISSIIQSKVRPLHHLKKSRAYRKIQTAFDFTVYIPMRLTRTSVAVKFFRDMTWLVDAVGFQTNVEAPEAKTAFLKVLEDFEIRVFWDIGANVGFYSWLTASKVQNLKEIVAFEPDTISYELLCKTIQRNKLDKIKVINCAVSNVDDQIAFIVDRVTGATGRIQDTVTAVESVQLDSLIKQGYAVPDLIKIDVEGAEHLVLNGASSLLSKHQPIMLIETANTQLIDDLESQGYTCTYLAKGNFMCIPNTQK